MKLLFCCLALGALPALGEQRDLPTAPITLYTSFQQDPPPAVLEALQDELESIMLPMNLHFQWRSLSAANGNEVVVELAVVTFQGRCDIASVVPRTGQGAFRAGALGWTHVSDGTILPFSDVDCDRIRGFVQRDLYYLPAGDREEAFGRAIGRVLAHELYHVFADTVRHGVCGVGKAAYTVGELLSPDFRFEQQESKALRTGKAHAALENNGGAPRGGPGITGPTLRSPGTASAGSGYPPSIRGGIVGSAGMLP